MSSLEKVPKGIFDEIEVNKAKFVEKFGEDICQLFPDVNRGGGLDFSRLLEVFGEFTKTDEREKYELTWHGKRDAKIQSQQDIVAKTLKYYPDESRNPETTENLYIEGDNLEVLKLLRNSYYGKVKMIYIDPPYNTGKEFVYNDNFTADKNEYEKELGIVDEYNHRMTANKAGSGRYHSDWLSMMYPRLKVARDLLTDDGVIFISIDHNEQANLKKLCDEIFGEENFIDNIIWDKKSSAKGVPPKSMMVNVHEYILAYQKNNNFKFVGEKRSEEKDGFKNPDNDPRGPWRESNIKSTTKSIEESFTITNPTTGKTYTNTWAFSEKSLKKMIEENRILWKDTLPKQKEFMNEMTNENKAIKSNWGVFDPQSTTVFLKKLIPEVKFDNPKPILLMNYLMRVSSESNDIILDFFSGSSSTAHAVMNLNAEDSGNRKFIMVQLPEQTDEKSEAYKAGYQNICEIGKERIRRAGDKILKDNAESSEPKDLSNLDTGFKVFKVADTNIKWISDLSADGQLGLDGFDYAKTDKDMIDFNPGFTDIDVVYELMLRRQDILLSDTTQKLDDIGSRTYFVGCTVLVCLEEEITREIVDKISSLNIDYDLSWIVFRDSAFNDDINLKTNTMNLLRTLLKEKNPSSSNQKILWI